MSAADFASGLAALLAGDATLQAGLVAVLGVGVTRVLTSNQPTDSIPDAQLPCWVIEQGDGQAAPMLNDGSDADGLVIGGYRQGFRSSLDIALLWRQPDRDTAFAQRGALPTLLAQLLLQNPQPGGVSHAFLERWIPDQAIRHPRHAWFASVVGEYEIPRS